MQRKATMLAVAGLAMSAITAPTLAGGSPEKTLVIIDPTNPESLYLGNYYKNARGIPDSNILYMHPDADDFEAFRAQNIPALLGSLDHGELADHIDFIVITPGNSFFVDAPGLVNDGCFAVNKFSISGAYTMSFIADEVLGGLPITTANRYFRTTEARAFTSSVSYLGGRPSTSPSARRYFVGSMLGYTGERGNTIDDLLAMIDRSVAVDGTFPDGTFYFMETNDPARSDPRDLLFDGAVDRIRDLGGNAFHLMGILPPDGTHDCLGIMTGIATVPLNQADITILPGAICDHLTSFAGAFDVNGQTKMSRWIANGASGSWGAVEEPCNYPGKFPHPRVHAQYFEGLSLGEALLRGGAFVPFQMLLYGDPLTRPFAHLPDINITNLPADPMDDDVLVLEYEGTTTHPDATVSEYELFIDGDRVADIDAGQSLLLFTNQLSDGWHELRLLGHDSTLVESAGSFVAPIIIDRNGHIASIGASAVSGDLASEFEFDCSADAPGIVELRLVQNDRVLASSIVCNATFSVFGATLGAGVSRVQAEALMHDGSVVRSEPIELDIAFTGSASAAPTANHLTKPVLIDEPIAIELPVSSPSPETLSYVILQQPAQATLLGDGHAGFVILDPDPGASGTDTIIFQVDGPDGLSDPAELTILYEPYPLDVNNDGVVTFADLGAYFQNPVDANLDGVIDVLDIQFLIHSLQCTDAPVLLKRR